MRDTKPFTSLSIKLWKKRKRGKIKLEVNKVRCVPAFEPHVLASHWTRQNIPNRCGWTIPVLPWAEWKAAAWARTGLASPTPRKGPKCTSARGAPSPARTALTSAIITDLTRGKSPSPALSVPTARGTNPTSRNTCGYTPETSLSSVRIVLTGPSRGAVSRFTCTRTCDVQRRQRDLCNVINVHWCQSWICWRIIHRLIFRVMICITSIIWPSSVLQNYLLGFANMTIVFTS